MPFGLCNAPATFQRLMENALRGLTFKGCLVYLDDIIVYGRTEEEHLERLEGVLSRLQSVGLKIKPEKCQLMRQSVRYLGAINFLWRNMKEVKKNTNFPIQPCDVWVKLRAIFGSGGITTPCRIESS
ncbi:Retrovirus-related Pol polyprotein from transposon [Trichinella sp. T6]|nr:Retrovirus-related Pol polyprotein from transposon [Trichinella sp. T6]